MLQIEVYSNKFTNSLFLYFAYLLTNSENT